MGAETTLRDSFNSSDPNRIDAANRDLGLGELLTLVIKGLTATETGVTPSSDVATLANQPSKMFQINATAGTSTGIKKLLIGPITGGGAVVPNPGEAVWDGGLKVLFNHADAITAASFTYAKADGTDKASALLRAIGEQDSKPAPAFP